LKQCVKCNSEMKKAYISGIQGEFEINKKPRGFLKDSPLSSKVIPFVCVVCGYIEFYAESPEKFS